MQGRSRCVTKGDTHYPVAYGTPALLDAIAALLGLAMAFVAVAASVITGNPMWDALGTLAIGVVLMVIAIAVIILLVFVVKKLWRYFGSKKKNECA